MKKLLYSIIVFISLFLFSTLSIAGPPFTYSENLLRSGNDLVYLDGNLGIGRIPTSIFDVYFDANTDSGILVENANAGSGAEVYISAKSDDSQIYLAAYSSTFAIPKFQSNVGIGVVDGSDLYISNLNLGAGVGDIIFADLTHDFFKIRTSDGSGDITMYTDNLIHIGTSGVCGIERKVLEAEATLSGATTQIEVNVPDNSRIVCVLLQVETEITASGGGASWAAAFSGGSGAAICTAQAFDLNTEFDKWVVGPTFCTDAETDITITVDTGAFTAGVIRAVVYCDTLIPMTDIP